MDVKKKQGFSLLEILVTVAVLSALSVGSVLAIPPLITKAYDARRKADVEKIRTYLETYYSDKDSYPSKLPDCGEPFLMGNSKMTENFPCDPITKEPYYYQVKGGNPQSYRLYAKLQNWNDESVAKVGCEGGCGQDCEYNYGVSSTNLGLIRCSYVCAPGGGKAGSCELYNDPGTSQCPVSYGRDPTCRNECSVTKNRCSNASGKNIPY